MNDDDFITQYVTNIDPLPEQPQPGIGRTVKLGIVALAVGAALATLICMVAN